LLKQGTVVSERIVSLEECYGTGLVRAEGDAPQVVGPPIVQQPFVVQQPVVMQPETVVVQEELVVAPGGQVVEVATTLVEEQPRPPVAVIVATSGNLLGESKPTGAWLEEIAGPYYVFLESGFEVHLASTMGGPVPIDEASLGEDFFTETAKRLTEENPQLLQDSLAISQISPDQVDCVFLAGGHGVYADFEPELAQWVTDANAMGKVIGAVCHGPVGLLGAIAAVPGTDDTVPLIAGRSVTGFTNEEEAAVGLTNQVPFLLESRMLELGGNYMKADSFTEFAIADGNLCTGQNPQSSVKTAILCVEAIQQLMFPP
jgi:putative intracellular protease/amidase